MMGLVTTATMQADKNAATAAANAAAASVAASSEAVALAAAASDTPLLSSLGLNKLGSFKAIARAASFRTSPKQLRKKMSFRKAALTVRAATAFAHKQVSTRRPPAIELESESESGKASFNCFQSRRKT
jgi:hypothetical protein